MPRLFDLVSVRDAKLKAAFFYALGDTLVAEHLEQASRIAYAGNRRWARVVTLQALYLSLVAIRIQILWPELYPGPCVHFSDWYVQYCVVSFFSKRQQCNLRQVSVPQGEMINDSGTMTGGGGKPRGGRMRLGSGAPKPVDQRAAEAELETAEKQEHASAQVLKPSALHSPMPAV